MNPSRTPDEPEWAPVRVEAENGFVIVRDTRQGAAPPLRFSVEDWAAFLEGVRRGEFDVPGQGDLNVNLPETDPRDIDEDEH